MGEYIRDIKEAIESTSSTKEMIAIIWTDIVTLD